LIWSIIKTLALTSEIRFPSGLSIDGDEKRIKRGFSAKNRFYRANRDLGRIFKTEFILQYLSEPELRRRIRRGLLKVEQLHALARDVFYGRRGRINARKLWEQMNTCSCLNLILACIVYWQACEISRVLSECDPVANGIDLSCWNTSAPLSGIMSCSTAKGPPAVQLTGTAQGLVGASAVGILSGVMNH
jgi:Tn3 transposase DDE domain